MKKLSFNLIEILLAVALLAFGVIVILGMLPSALNVSRTAATQNYSSEIVDQIAGFLMKQDYQTLTDAQTPVANNDAGVKTFFNTFAYETTAGEIEKNYRKLVGFTADNGDFKRTGTWGVYRIDANNARGAYVIVMGDAISGRVDFSALLRTCLSPRSYEKFTRAHSTSGDHDCGASACSLTGYTNTWTTEPATMVTGKQLNFELSWPLSLPYAERTKRYYSLEVNK